jgi:hypothetical protein
VEEHGVELALADEDLVLSLQLIDPEQADRRVLRLKDVTTCPRYMYGMMIRSQNRGRSSLVRSPALRMSPSDHLCSS